MTKFWTLPLELKPAGGAFDDPALLVAPTNSEFAILFDCGTLHGLKTRDLQKVRWLFLTHLHIDHLIGFDHLLRVRLFSDLPLTVYGPAGTVEAIAHRLKGYAWNLTSGSPFTVRVFECQSESAAGAQFACHHRFDRQAAHADAPGVTGDIALGAGLCVTSHPVQHGVPCLAYRLDRYSPPKFSLETALGLGLAPGPWVRNLVAGQAVTQTVSGVTRDQRWLAARLLSPPLRHSLGFLTDTRLDDGLTADLAEFFRQVDVLCCETAYLDSERELASQNLHMTTTQAATLAALAEAGHLGIFHLSRRHHDSGPERHLAEVRQVHPSAALLADWPGKPTGSPGEAATRAASESLS
jgi:ribonuclease Z